jgi:hypothetical protein
MFVSARGEGCEALWFGDCAALVQRPGLPVQVVGDALDKRAAEAARAGKLAKAGNVAPAAGTNRAEFLPALRAARNRVNTVEGSWAFSPDARCAGHAARLVFDAPPGTRLLLVSDGFFALTSDYGCYGADALVEAAASKGLRALYTELRQIENADPDGRHFPRFKISDDARAVLIRSRGGVC